MDLAPSESGSSLVTCSALEGMRGGNHSYFSTARPEAAADILAMKQQQHLPVGEEEPLECSAESTAVQTSFLRIK